MSQELFLAGIAERLEKAGIPFMVVGSLASSSHGQPRATMDVDLVVDPTGEQLERFLSSLGEDLYTSPEGARDALKRRAMFNVIDLSEGWKADLIVRKDRPFSHEELSRRQMGSVAGRAMPVASPEDVILAKLEWDGITPSERQVRDALNVIVVQADRLDCDYLRKWAAELGVSEKLEDLLQQAGELRTEKPS
jgi:hypothetical protein